MFFTHVEQSDQFLVHLASGDQVVRDVITAWALCGEEALDLAEQLASRAHGPLVLVQRATGHFPEGC